MKTLLTLAVAACAALTAHAWTATLGGYFPTYDVEGNMTDPGKLNPDAISVMAYVIDSGLSGGTTISGDRVNAQVNGLRDALKNGAYFSDANALGDLLKTVPEYSDGSGPFEDETKVVSVQALSPRNMSIDINDGANRNAYYTVLVETLSNGQQYAMVTGWVRYTSTGIGGSDSPVFDTNDLANIALLPEPTALALLALGVAGVVLRRRVTA